MVRRLIAIAIFFPLLLTGCLAQMMSDRISDDVVAGAYAQKVGKWDLSRRAYARAIVSSEIIGYPAKQRAVLHYEYGRALGVTCFFAKAESSLLFAYDLDKQAGSPLYFSLVELGRLSLDLAKYRSATQYYEKALVELDKANFSTTSPIGYSDVLDEYALALNKSGDSVKSGAFYAKSRQIRSMYPEGKSITDRTPYGTQCTVN